MVRSVVIPVNSPERLDNDLRDGRDQQQDSVCSALLPRSEIDDQIPARRKVPTLTPLNCLALVIGLQIGSGVFSAPSLIAQQVRSPAEALGVFVVAGLLVWTGAASFVELGLLVPSNGGIQEYLRASWGDYSGYLFSWAWIGVVKPAGNAVISTIFADYLLKAFPSSDPISPWTTKIVALGGVASLTMINCLGATAGAKAANVFMIVKLAAIGSVIAIGFTSYVLGHSDGVPASYEGWFGGDRPNSSQPTPWESLGAFSTAVFAALFCYGGWESAGFVIGEMENPAKDLPIVINGAMTLVIVGFSLMNVSLYLCLPFDVVRESKAVVVVSCPSPSAADTDGYGQANGATGIRKSNNRGVGWARVHRRGGSIGHGRRQRQYVQRREALCSGRTACLFPPGASEFTLLCRTR